MSISFSVGIYEKTKNILFNGHLKTQLDIINYDFCDKVILVNEINNKNEINDVVKLNFPDFKVYYTNDDCVEVLNYFNLTEQELNPGYWYSIHHFNQFYHNNCEYNFHISSDCHLIEFDPKFISESIEILKNNENILITMPSWEQSYQAPKVGSLFEIDNFWCERGFTDQIFFSKVENFKKDIYHYRHPASERFPVYGRECFERRVDSYMQTVDKFMAVHKKSCYAHIKGSDMK